MDLSKLDLSRVEVIPAFGLGRFAPFYYERSAYQSRIRVSPGWFTAWALLLLMGLWLAGAAGVYALIKYKRGFEKVQFNHVLLLPLKKEDYRRSKAEYYLELGHAALAAQRYGEAFHHLRIGLAGVPEDTDARRVVVELYLAVKRPDLARTLIVDGMAYTAGDVEYLQWIFASLLRLQEDDTVIDLAHEFLRAIPDANPNARHVVTMAEATAHFFRGRYTQAEAVLRRERSLATQDGLLLLAKIERERGELARALECLRGASERFPDAAEPYRELVAELRRQGAVGATRRVIVERQLSHPHEFEPFLDQLEELHRQGEEAEWREREAQFWERFGKNDAAVDLLALLASRLGRFETARRILEQRRSQATRLETASTALAEALLAAGRAEQALAVIQEAEADGTGADRGELLALKVLAFMAVGNEASAQRNLSSYLERAFLRPDLLAVLAQRLVSVSGDELAERVWSRALEIDPNHQAVLTQRLSHSLSADDWESTMPLIKRLLTTRKPSRALCGALAERLSLDRYLLLPQRAEALTGLVERATSGESRE